MDAFPVLVRIAQLLHRHGLEAILIGNAAAALRGAPVTTVDLDFLFRKTPANLKKLKAIAAKLDGLKKESDLALRDQIRRLLALPMERRTHFLRKRVGIRMSCI